MTAIALLATACGGAGPSAVPGDTGSIINALVRRGVTVRAAVSGESVCRDPGLAGNALHLFVTGPDGDRGRDVYLYVFRPRDHAGAGPSLDACRDEYVEATGATVDRVDVPPYTALGADWTPPLREAVDGALREAAAGGR